MPNWCNNYIKISGDESTIRTLTSVIKSLKSSDDNGPSDDVFKSLIGLPQHMSDGDYKEKWYDTNIEWFGTKWDISYEEHMFTFNKDEITLSCETAWSPPIPFLENLCKMYKVNAYLFYSEGGVGFAGESTFNWVNGELEVYDDECGYLEGIYKYSNEEFWSEVEYRADSILDEDQSLEDFLGEFEFVSDEDKVELTRIYNETINNNDEDDDTEGE
jgi:hypothetical protein